jgi:CDGSH-type Zn-finger protein
MAYYAGTGRSPPPQSWDFMEVGVPNVFPIAPYHLIYLAQIITLVTYVSSPKEKTTIYICCECPKFNHNFFCDGTIKDAHDKTKSKNPTLGAPDN